MVEFFDKSSGAAVLPPEGLPRVGAIIAGKYRVEGVLGAGGMGVVLSARHVTLDQLVAIKVLLSHDEQARAEANARLLLEARAAAALASEYVVRVYDVGEDENGAPFIVMERLEGADLGEVLRLQRSLPSHQASALVLQAARAVAEAHRAGIVHRDLKPSNLFLTRRSNGSLQLKVLDFGIAKSLRPDKLVQETLTGARTALGSPSYMSPEQVRDPRRVDALTDLWSLGVILYELLTGRVAFQAPTLPGVCAAIVADSPSPPSVLIPGIPAELDRIVLRCLEKDKDLRYANAEELCAALEPFADPALEYDSVVPSSWLPRTMPMPGSPPEETPLPPVSEARPSAKLPFSFPLSNHERTLESGTPPSPVLISGLREKATRRSGARARPIQPVLLGLGVLLAAGIVLAVLMRAKAPAPPAVASGDLGLARPGSSPPPAGSAAAPSEPKREPQSPARVPAPLSSAPPEAAPSHLRQRAPRPSEAPPKAPPPEIQLSR